MSVRGALAPTSFALQHARAVVVTDDAKAYASNLNSRGRFVVTIPAGHSFRLYIANNEAPTVQRVVGKIVARNHVWLSAKGPTLTLGTLHVAGTAAPSSPAARAKFDEDDGNAGANSEQDDTVDEDAEDLCGEHVSDVNLDPDVDVTDLDDNEPSDLPPC